MTKTAQSIAGPAIRVRGLQKLSDGGIALRLLLSPLCLTARPVPLRH
jgi:hypothetical protein